MHSDAPNPATRGYNGSGRCRGGGIGKPKHGGSSAANPLVLFCLSSTVTSALSLATLYLCIPFFRIARTVFSESCIFACRIRMWAAVGSIEQVSLISDFTLVLGTTSSSLSFPAKDPGFCTNSPWSTRGCGRIEGHCSENHKMMDEWKVGKGGVEAALPLWPISTGTDRPRHALDSNSIASRSGPIVP